MMRQSASRNQRSKGGGFRLKLVLQICLLLAICTWLLYQVKHSHDKKIAFEDKMAKIASKASSKQPDLFDFGRKGLPLVKENDSMSQTRAKDDANEEEQEEEEEDGEQDQGMKHGGAKDEEAKRDGDDTIIDELDQDNNNRGDEENEEEEEFFSEEEKDGPVEEDGLFDNKEGEDSAQEAREENYKRDDASSAVAHDSLMDIEDSNVDAAMNIKNATLDPISNLSNNVSFGENVVTVTTNADDLSINGTHSGTKQIEVELNKPAVSTVVSNQIEISVSDDNNNSLAIQSGSRFNDSVSTSEIPQLGSSGLIQAHDQNYKYDASEGHESEEDHTLSSNARKEGENGGTTRTDLSAIPVIQNEVKDSDDKAAG